MGRTFLFKVAYWVTSIIVGLLALPMLLLPGRRILMWWLRAYSRTMVMWMRVIAKVELEVRGRDRVPKGPSIIAAKHQSWGDGYAMFSQFYDLAFVTGDHLEKIPAVGWILRKMQAVVVDSCGGAEARQRLIDEELVQARAQNRRILIYPEGELVEVGYHARYKKGVFHMYEAYGCPVVPVATNLGLFWPKRDMNLKPGTAVIEFLDPIPPGMEKDAFMARLQDQIETASLALLPKEFKIPENRLVEDVESKASVPPASHSA
ncbi:MAG: lysophospholipid acyltransferase family protein [Ahrensia sp.]|nr:lysophospholipid acyltransferase family protein [Ahrensia sp.]